MLAGRYRLVERLGAGGMSVVWRAYDEVLGRQVAVKLLASQFAADPAFRAGIRREARAAARLSHPHITNVYDYGEAVAQDGGPLPFVVMELVEGHTLAQRLASGPLPWRTALEIGRQVAAALAAAHARGLVHRDVTPANIMLTPDGVKVVDFGISAIVGERGEQIILGTPAYLAPERLSGEPAQPATDVYSLGLVLHHALAGGLPPAPLPPVPAPVAALIAACLAQDPRSRPDSRGLAEQLAVLAGTAVPARPARAPVPVPVAAGPSGTRVMPPHERVPRAPRPQAPFRHSRFGRLLLPMSLLSLLLLGLWGFSTLRSRNPTALPPHQSHAPTVAHKPSPTPDQRACAVGYRVTLDVGAYFTAELTIQNTGKVAINGWTLEFDFPQDQRVTTGLEGVWAQSDTHVTVDDLVYNRSVARGKAVTIHFIGSHHNKKNDAPSRFTVNGIRCQQAPQG